MEASAPFYGKRTLSAKSLRVILTVFVILTTSGIHGRTVRRQRSAATETCQFDNTCGWEVYDPYTRDHQYYVPSSCTCPSEERCIMVTDDLTMQAYVYKCRVIPTRKSKSRSTGNRESVSDTTTVTSS